MLTHLVSIPFSEMPHAMFSHETHWVSPGKRENKNPLIFTLRNTLGHGHDQNQAYQSERLFNPHHLGQSL
jgi:hypothetical protein